ncbi:hypothetical protein C7Y71_007115 [Pseudoprevotella muciniphila]|uniref:Uncharacterized protein n=1 Tax=Pseudoprevotella muciniphila TaxID=2133944 RepID=A0A5P8E707_9BACT|nr:hypothetical protein [Pseudoprevotella muciniphila]QFQ12805.1 hypothetical protein C7Y71_007115 [Pseudoprevotella muciniphila]
MNKRQHWTYEELMECYANDEEFNVSDCKEGMLFFAHKKPTLGWVYLVDTENHECFELVTRQGHLTVFTDENIDHDAIEKVSHGLGVYTLSNRSGIIMHDFEDGVARLTRYYNYCEYLYGHGKEEEHSDCVHAYIDKHCNVLIPFRSMTDKQKVLLRKRAVEMVCKHQVH